MTASTIAEFLHRLRPGGIHCLTSIIPDGKTTKTKSFTDPDTAAVWATTRNAAGENLYYHVNPTLKALTRKASKTDIARVEFLHVDIDPRAGEDISAEQKRIRDLLTDDRPKDIPEPTLIVFSGAGMQALWRLAEPIVIDGDVTKAADAERYTRQLEGDFKADNTHNVDRLLRLPFTVNYPNAKKRAKGREPADAKVICWADDAPHALASFKQAPAVVANAGKTPSRGKVGRAPIGREVVGRVGVAELEAWAAANGKTIEPHALAVLALGVDPLEANKYPSRSEALWAVLCGLARADVPDEMIVAAILDPDNLVSACVRDKPNPPKEAWGQLAKARAQVEADRQEATKQPPMLSPKTPLKSAREFVSREQPDFLHYNGDWLSYDVAAYAELEDGTLRRDVYGFLERAKMPPTAKQQEAGHAVGDDFRPDTTTVNQVIDALRAVAHRPRDSFAPPCWLEGDGPPAHELVACRNGLLHLPTGELHENTPRFFTRSALTFDYDASAPTPTEWLAFLKSIWPEEPQAIAGLQELFGYLLVPDTSQQKIFLLVGPTRSGKGTVARVLTELVGPPNVCAPTLASMGGDFGMEPMLGKQLAILGDVRLDGRANHTAITGSLLSISGEDFQTVNRKNKSHWNGRLGVRFLLLTNYIPKFSGDNSNALPNRFVPLVMTQSFLGSEDLGLLNRLLGEMPGILNWAIEGWRNLKSRGYFDLSESSKAAIDELFEKGSPVASFMRDECVLDSEATEPKDDLFLRWKAWCVDADRPQPGNKDWFCGQLKAAANLITVTPREKTPDGNVRRVAAFRGVRLLTEEEKAQATGDGVPKQSDLALTKPPF